MDLKIYVPQSLEDITLREYKKYEKIIQANKDDENSERFLNLKMLEIFCNISFEQAAGMQLVDYERILMTLYSILQEQPKLVKTFKIGSREFGFHPNLEEMTFGEFIDLDTYISDMQQMEKAMAVLYRPIINKHKDTYKIQEYLGDTLHDTMLDTPMAAVVSSILFFYDLGKDLSIAMMKSLPKEEIQLLQEQASVRGGDGINLFTVYHKEIFGGLNLLQK